MPKTTIFWFRRDLRLNDNAGLYHALKSGKPVLPIFIFDENILNDLENRSDARVHFIHDTLHDLQTQLASLGSSLLVKYGTPKKVLRALLKSHEIEAVYTNRDYEPYALERDEEVKTILEKKGIGFYTFKDQVIFEKGEVLKDDGTPYTVFTPYSKKWRKKMDSQMVNEKQANGRKRRLSYFLQSYPTEKYFSAFLLTKPFPIPTLEEMKFQPSTIPIPDRAVKRSLIKKYGEQRNFPAIRGTSRLGIHFRFGTISIREKAQHALNLSDVYVSELIWRDFYAMIMAHFPKVVTNAFRKKYEFIEWDNNKTHFEKWCNGQTGYPIVDAGMRELNATGFMHNRVRMIVASFLTKHLLIDWRWGEAYFAEKLLDFDLASNNGGWQWAAGCGTDAAPYFRVFNPYTQQQKFDKDMVYVKKWVPEYGTPEYVEAIVEHKFARERCLRVYKEGLAKAQLNLT